MRSPCSVYSYSARYIHYDDGNVSGYWYATSGGFGVRPALLSERNYAFAVLKRLVSCAFCQS